jgi:hypothetical protein
MKVHYIEHPRKRHHSLQATRLIHEHYGTIMSYVYSRLALRQLVTDRFEGEWKYLHRALFEIPEDRAARSLIELGLYIRVLDDDEERDISSHWGERSFGEIVQADGSQGPLTLREVGNKIIHAERYEWSITASSDPTVTCFAPADQVARFSWAFAPINLVALGCFCGGLMS